MIEQARQDKETRTLSAAGRALFAIASSNYERTNFTAIFRAPSNKNPSSNSQVLLKKIADAISELRGIGPRPNFFISDQEAYRFAYPDVSEAAIDVINKDDIQIHEEKRQPIYFFQIHYLILTTHSDSKLYRCVNVWIETLGNFKSFLNDSKKKYVSQLEPPSFTNRRARVEWNTPTVIRANDIHKKLPNILKANSRCFSELLHHYVDACRGITETMAKSAQDVDEVTYAVTSLFPSSYSFEETNTLEQPISGGADGGLNNVYAEATAPGYEDENTGKAWEIGTAEEKDLTNTDNPFSESLFKTLKYHVSFPATERFETIFDVRTWTVKFAAWYNNVHMHSALKFITPNQRHSGRDRAIMVKRHDVYLKAKKRNPQRWSRNTRNWELPSIVMLNANKKNKARATSNESEKMLAA